MTGRVRAFVLLMFLARAPVQPDDALMLPYKRAL